MDANTPVAGQGQEGRHDQQTQHDDHVDMADLSFFRKWGGLLVLALALAIIIIDTTLLNVSLKTIIIDLHTNLKNMQWVITIYSLILAAFTITGGRLGDLFGRKKMFLAGAVIFAIGSFIASISKNVGMMITGEAIIEGFGAALMMPATASLLITNFKGRDRAIAFGVWGGVAAASSAIGPILGGWLTTNYSWRWGFRINIAVVALVLIGSFLVKENHRLRTKAKIDYIGVVLSALGLLSIVFGFIQASTYGWWKVKEHLVVFSHTINLGSLSATPIFVLLGIIILALFMYWERKFESWGRTPLLSLHLFENTQFVSGASTMAVLALGQAGLFFTIPVFLQAVRHLDALHTGLTLLPMSLALLVAAPSSAFLVKFIPPKRLVQTGVALSLISFIVLRYSLSTTATAAHLAPGFIIFGLGMGLMMAQVSNLTLSAVSPKEAGEASGVNNTLRMVGQTLGSAILGAILLSTLTSHVKTGVQNSANIPDQAKSSIIAGVDQHVSDISFGVNTQADTAGIPQKVVSELESITNVATVDANKQVMIYGIIFIAAGLLVSTRLPNVAQAHPETAGPETDAADEPDIEEGESEQPLPTPAIPAAMAAAAVSAPEPTEKKSRAKLWGGIALVLVILVGLFFANHKKKNPADNSNRPEVIVQNEPDANTNVNSNTDTKSNTNASAQPVTPQQDTQVTAPAPAPAPQPAPATGQTFTEPNLRFTFMKPDDWKIVKDSNGEIVFKSGSAMYNVQSSPSTGDWNSLKTFLEQQPNISNVRRVNWGTRDLFQFDIAGSYKTGYAFLENGRLYYVLGAGSENTPLVSMTTF